jgi:urate oxidase
MLNIGLHCRLVGRPGRAAALARFLDYIAEKPGVWIARRIDIARHWRERFPYAAGLRPSRMERDAFLAWFGGVFEHSPFIAERAFDKGLHDTHDSAAGLSAALNTAFRQANEDDRLSVLKAHPDLAGRLALAGDLTPDSMAEQASAGLDRLTPEELARFTALNESYVQRFGFPFIIAVKAIKPAGAGKTEILGAFESRIGNGRATEIATACREVEKIARLRIEALFEKGTA